MSTSPIDEGTSDFPTDGATQEDRDSPDLTHEEVNDGYSYHHLMRWWFCVDVREQEKLDAFLGNPAEFFTG